MARFFSTALPEAFSNPFTEQTVDQDPNFPGTLTTRTYAGNIVDYGFSLAGVDVDLERLQQIGGFAQGDLLTDIGDISGTAFNDVIRGSDPIPAAAEQVGNEVSGLIIINNPGQNDFTGGPGRDILEGRGGGDFLDGGSDSDTASYESSSTAVTVTVNDPITAVFAASGGDAQGDILFSIENLVGSRFNDRLTGASNNNILAGGRGNDTLDGLGGSDTADYSRDLFSAAGLTAGRVDVRLGLNGANGTATEFVIVPPDNFQVQVGADTLISIENVIGTEGADTIIGNQAANTLDGRGGNDLLDGGLGNDTVIGGAGSDTLSFASHNSLAGQTGAITLGLNGADGSARFATTGATVRIVEADVLRGIENVIGSNLVETINGNEQANTISGRGGNDRINGGAGDDSYDLRGQLIAHGSDRYLDTSGNDRVLVSAFSDIASATRVGNDLVVTLVANFGGFTVIDHFAGRQIETIVAGTQSRVLSIASIGGDAGGLIAGTAKNDTLDGRGGDDFVFGDAGRDCLLGGSGNDLLDGGKGADVLNGETGNDTLRGGKGPDVFVFAPGTGAGHDVILDFENSDRIDLTAFHTTFRRLDMDRDGRLEHGEGGSGISVKVQHGDTVLSFAGGSIRMDDAIGLKGNDFIL